MNLLGMIAGGLIFAFSAMNKGEKKEAPVKDPASTVSEAKPKKKGFAPKQPATEKKVETVEDQNAAIEALELKE